MKHIPDIQETSKQDATKSFAGLEGIAIALPQNNTDLPDALKTAFENLSGLSLDDVQVHYTSSRPAQLQALAHNQGVDKA